MHQHIADVSIDAVLGPLEGGSRNPENPRLPKRNVYMGQLPYPNNEASVSGAALCETINGRLTGLRSEYTAGQQMLADLEARQAELRQTLLRISGAIQVLEELLDDPGTLELENNDKLSDALAGK